MDMLMTDAYSPVTRAGTSSVARLDPIAIMVQSAFCALPLVAIAVAIAIAAR